MPTVRRPLGIALAALIAISCSVPVASAETVKSDAPRAAASTEAGNQAARAVEAIAADLYSELAREGGNLVFSPYSVAVALAMTRAGAVSETATQMDSVLHADLVNDLHAGFNTLEQELAKRAGTFEFGDTKFELDLSTANQLFGQRGYEFEKRFLDLLASQYGAGMELVDYVDPAAREQARAAINDWVAERTRDRITELIPEDVLNDMTRLVLTNAIYLRAKWIKRFEQGGTAAAPFHRLDGTTVSAQLMRLGRTKLSYARGTDHQAVRLPYFGNLSMVVIVPEPGRFKAFERSLSGDVLHEIANGFQEGLVLLRLPRFEFRTRAPLREALSALGMPIAFTDAADFRGMSPRGDELFIRDVLHEAFISVDEEGTEAAAATAVVMEATSAPNLIVDLTVDRPFLFLIRDDVTGTVLFLGRVLDPNAGK